MKILIVNTFDIYGGAARAAYRLHRALLDQNIDSQMLVQHKSSDDNTVITETSAIKKKFNALRPKLDEVPLWRYPHRDQTFFSVAHLPFSNIVKKINAIDPDIVHLHWICLGMMRIEDIAKIKAPIVWTLHDMWAFTGGCHYAGDCMLYKANCGSCNVLGSKKEKDLSRQIFNRKKKVFSQMRNLTIVGVSRWLTACSSQSSLLGDKKHINLPNPLDTDQFKKRDKSKVREVLGLPHDKKLVLFGAVESSTDLRKGLKELQEAMYKLRLREIELVVFGNTEEGTKNDFGFTTHYLGHIDDDAILVNLYGAADVMIVPSLQEAFGQTASEAMSCGTPVIAFAHTGLLDIVDHKENGYLAQPFDTQDLARGIEWILDHEDYDTLCRNAREKIVTTFDSKIVAKKYIKLYEDILNKK